MLSVVSILDELKRLGNAERAVWDKTYHKSQREHWGVPVPASSLLARNLSKELSEKESLQIALELWETNLFDPMICSAKILALPKLKASTILWEQIVLFLEKVDGWALEDTLAHAAWKCILEDESRLDLLEKWTKHPNFWMRRAALVYTLPFAKAEKSPERTLEWASALVGDPEWFIQKAIGWWLRVLGEHNPGRVLQFLKIHWKSLKPVARRESTRKLAQSSELDLAGRLME